jgi:hypothetical protein
MRRLYQDTREIRNVANFVFLTNLERAILLDKEDRRYFVLNSPAQPQELSYYVEFNSWWRENLGVIRAFLEGIDLGGFNRSAPAPVTEAKLNLIKGSEAPVVQELREMIFEREAPFHVDIVTYPGMQLKMRSERSKPYRLASTGCQRLGPRLGACTGGIRIVRASGPCEISHSGKRRPRRSSSKNTWLPKAG